jgi:putative DNA primase/helicase
MSGGDTPDEFAASFEAAKAQLRGPKRRCAALNGGEAPVGPTEDEVALGFAARYAGRLAYDHTAQHWLIYDNARWKPDLAGTAYDLARQFTREARAALVAMPAAMGRLGFSGAVERAARSDPALAVSHEVWDRDPWLLGVPGGVVDLRSGATRPGAPDLWIGRQTAVAPAPPDTPHPIWSGFLADATRGDAGLQDFLLRLAGYVLTGEVSEEVMAFLYGPGGNGKGVFLGTVASILGDYAVSMPIDVFTVNTRINLEYYRAQMAGARLVTSAETDAGTAWAEGQIKELTGNETPISGRQPHGRAFNFRPVFKLIITGNHAPKLKGRSAAMERRLRIVPFEHDPAVLDLDLKVKLRPEWPAILRWMIEGCLIWQRTRLGTADAVMAATSDYFRQQDAYGRWVEERCVLDPSGVMRTKPGLLRANFAAWALASGEEAVNANEFAELLNRDKRLRRVTVHGVSLVAGIGLRRDEDDRFTK